MENFNLIVYFDAKGLFTSIPMLELLNIINSLFQEVTIDENIKMDTTMQLLYLKCA